MLLISCPAATRPLLLLPMLSLLLLLLLLLLLFLLLLWHSVTGCYYVYYFIRYYYYHYCTNDYYYNYTTMTIIITNSTSSKIGVPLFLPLLLLQLLILSPVPPWTRAPLTLWALWFPWLLLCVAATTCDVIANRHTAVVRWASAARRLDVAACDQLFVGKLGMGWY